MKFARHSHIGEMPVDQPSAPPTPSTAPRVYRVDLNTQAPYEAGALLLTLLAFPKETEDDDTFVAQHASLCTSALLERSRSDPEWARTHHPIKPEHFSVQPDVVKKNLRTLHRALRDRMVAGRVANAIIFDAAGLRPTLPKGCEGFSIKQLMKMALDDLGQEDAENAEQRIWRPSQPVIHLAAAVQAFMNRPDKAPYEVSVGDIMFDLAAILWIQERALRTWKLMRDHGDRFRMGKEKQILIWTELPDIKEFAAS